MDFVELWSVYWPKWTLKSYVVFFILLIILFFILGKMIFSLKWRKMQVLASGILAVYLMLIFASTVFTRRTAPGYQYQLEVFWSYRWGIEIYGKEMVREIVLNIFMLMPIGVMLPVAVRDKFDKRICAGFWITFFTGFCCSCLIEILQLFLRRGLFEFDDVIHNTIGVVIGYLLWKVVEGIKSYG